MRGDGRINAVILDHPETTRSGTAGCGCICNIRNLLADFLPTTIAFDAATHTTCHTPCLEVLASGYRIHTKSRAMHAGRDEVYEIPSIVHNHTCPTPMQLESLACTKP